MVVCGDLWWFAVVCGGLWSFAVVCGRLRWFAMVCGGSSVNVIPLTTEPPRPTIMFIMFTNTQQLYHHNNDISAILTFRFCNEGISVE